MLLKKTQQILLLIWIWRDIRCFPFLLSFMYFFFQYHNTVNTCFCRWKPIFQCVLNLNLRWMSINSCLHRAIQASEPEEVTIASFSDTKHSVILVKTVCQNDRLFHCVHLKCACVKRYTHLRFNSYNNIHYKFIHNN